MRSNVWQLLRIVLGVALFTSVAVYLFHHSDRLRPPPPPQQNLTPISEFYEWRTATAFASPRHNAVADATIEELCKGFPSHLLHDVQPILKTGRATRARAEASLRSTSACLDNLLIFSDLSDIINGHPVIDLFRDIPHDMLANENITEQVQPYRELQELAANETLTEANLSKIRGWTIDKFKFLPSISRAWRMAPGKSWYVFYEGDTYVVWDTVFRLLQNFDPDVPQYFGSPSPRGEGDWFANGGPGYILSREAMRRLVHEEWDAESGEWLGPKFNEKYWGNILADCCGDSILGWILLEHGVKLKGLWPMFNPHPLRNVPFDDLYWCQPVLTMHKSDIQLATDFWRWEWKFRGQNLPHPILYRDIAESFFDFRNGRERKYDWDNAGWNGFAPADDDPNQPHVSADACALACQTSEPCFQWTYHLQQCTFVRSFGMGAARDASPVDEQSNSTQSLQERRYYAGWDLAKIRQWMDARPCSQVQWVRPSVERVF